MKPFLIFTNTVKVLSFLLAYYFIITSQQMCRCVEEFWGEITYLKLQD